MSADSDNIVVTTSSYLDYTTTNSPSPTRPESVRRCLFGAANSDDNRNFVKRELDAISKADEKNWNFNFTAGIPLVGKFQWESIKADVPAAFKTVNLVKKEEPVVEKKDPSFNPEKAHTSKNPLIKKKLSSSSIRRRSIKIRDKINVAKAKRNLIFSQESFSQDDSIKIQSEPEYEISTTSSNSSHIPSDSESSAEESSSNINNNNSDDSSPSHKSTVLLTDLLPMQKKRELSESSDECCSKRAKLDPHPAE